MDIEGMFVAVCSALVFVAFIMVLFEVTYEFPLDD